jgi:hypothetical protein
MAANPAGARAVTAPGRRRRGRLTQRPEVADVRTSVVYEHIRNPHIQPAD